MRTLALSLAREGPRMVESDDDTLVLWYFGLVADDRWILFVAWSENGLIVEITSVNLSLSHPDPRIHEVKGVEGRR